MIYFKMDNGANTCGIDFNFQNDKTAGDLEEVEVNEDEESIPLNSQSNATSRVEAEDLTEESPSSIINDDEPRGDYFFELKVLEELFKLVPKLCTSNFSEVSKRFISEFNVVSEEGR